MDKIADLLLDAICVVDAQGVFEYISPAGERIFGYTPEEMIGRRMTDFIAPFDLERTLSAAQKVMSGEPHLHFENCYVRKDGQLVHLMWSARRSDADQKRVAVARDVSALRQAEASQAALFAISEAAHASGDVGELIAKIHSILATLMPVPHFSVLIQDPQQHASRVVYQGLAANSTPDQAHQEAHADQVLYEAMRGRSTAWLLTPHTLGEAPAAWQAVYQPAWAAWLGVPLSSPNGRVGALILKRYQGDPPWSDKHQELLQYVSNQIAMAIERKELYARLQHMAQFDALTGLPNRYLLEDRLRGALTRAERAQSRVALLFLDLDHFKLVNDRLGHAVGDRLLQEVGQRLRAAVRESDTVARLGGDEFVVLLESLQEADHVQPVLEKIQLALQGPFHLDGHLVQVSPSIGLAHFPNDGRSGEQLLRHADDAMYQAKRVAHAAHATGPAARS
ncbi:diguanylate cyclase [Curvibacter sp. RS43]|uniref:sensor domain-containing protein n=1 Tax=Curvibacter microcysteis TaxID=3026419 RepID=UPI002361B163|nr:diguanylate cyclase [Curvibacter sp. RS43]MDD0812016.1 diguanylate cyclase [Curvibacter sp. RS43]